MNNKRRQYNWVYRELRKMAALRSICEAYDDGDRFKQSTADYLDKLEDLATADLHQSVGGSIYYHAVASFDKRHWKRLPFWQRHNLAQRGVFSEARKDWDFRYTRKSTPKFTQDEIPF